MVHVQSCHSTWILYLGPIRMGVFLLLGLNQSGRWLAWDGECNQQKWLPKTNTIMEYIYICMNAVNLVQMLDKLDLEQIQEYNPRFVAIGACSQPFSAFEGFCVCLKWNWFKGNLFWSPCAWWSRYAAMFMTFPFAHDYSQSPKIKYPPYRTSNWIDSKLDCCLLGIFIPYSYICIYIYIVYICIYLSIYLFIYVDRWMDGWMAG
jgi:hypothetical protein